MFSPVATTTPHSCRVSECKRVSRLPDRRIAKAKVPPLGYGYYSILLIHGIRRAHFHVGGLCSARENTQDEKGQTYNIIPRMLWFWG